MTRLKDSESQWEGNTCADNEIQVLTAQQDRRTEALSSRVNVYISDGVTIRGTKLAWFVNTKSLF